MCATDFMVNNKEYMGIMINPEQLNKLVKGNMSKNLSLLYEATQILGMKTIWFSYPQPKLTVDQIIGHISLGTKQWYKGEFPVPRVVYDRAVFHHPFVQSGQQIRKELLDQKVTFVNAIPYFSRWKTYKVLADDLKVSSHLPEMEILLRTFDIEDILLQNKKICVIPCVAGNKDIMIISKEQDHLYKVINPNNTVNRYDSFVELTNSLAHKLRNKKQVLQQFVEGPKYNSYPFDFSLLMHKIDLRTWDCTALMARLKKQEHITTKAKGFITYDADEVLGSVWPQCSVELKHEIQSLAESVCTILETQYGRFGEIGLTIVIDRDRKIWIQDINSKPGKAFFANTLDQDVVSQIYERPLKYAQMLLEYRGNTIKKD